MFVRIKASGQRHSLTRRIMTILGSLLTLALVLGSLGFIRPSQVQAAPVNNKEPYTIGLEYNYNSQDQNTCYVYDSNNGFCSKRDDGWAVNRDRNIARLLVNTANYPEHDGPLSVVLRAPKSAVAEILVSGNIGGKTARSANPQVTQGSETIDGKEYTTSTISWEEFAADTSELAIPFSFRVQDNVSNEVPFKITAKATPGTDAQAKNPPSLIFTVHYQQLANVMIRNAGSLQQGGGNGGPTVIGAPRHDTNGHFPTDVSALTRSSFSLRVPTLVGQKGVRTVESAMVTWQLPSYRLANGSYRKPLVRPSENSGWTVSADGSVTHTFTVPAGTDANQYNAVLKREIETAELSVYFPGMWDPSSLMGSFGNNITATISYTPYHAAEDEQSIVASTGTDLHITSATNNGIGKVDKFTNWNGLYSSQSQGDTERMRKSDLPWSLSYTNTSGLPVHHLVLTDQLSSDETALKLVGLRGLTINGFDSSKAGCQSVDPNDASQSQCRGNITNVNLVQIRAYTDTTDTTHPDIYSGSQLMKTAGGIEVRFDPAKTYVRFDIRLVNSDGNDYTVPVQTVIGLIPLTQFRNPEHPAYRDPPAGVSADTFNSHINSGSASGQFQVDNQSVSAQVAGAQASVVVKKFSEWLDLQAPTNDNGNNSLATINGGYTHRINVSANIDDSKDWSSARLIILLPKSFIPNLPNGSTDLTKDYDDVHCIDVYGAYGGPGYSEVVKNVSYRHNYAGGRNALIVSLNPDGLKKLQFPDQGSSNRKQLWTYVNGKIDPHALEGNTGTFDDYFTADVAPAQSGEGTVPDITISDRNRIRTSFTLPLRI